MDTPPPTSNPTPLAAKRRRKILRLSALAAFFCLTLAGPGYRAGLWELRVAFGMLGVAAALGGITFALWLIWTLVAKRRRTSPTDPPSPLAATGWAVMAAVSVLIPLSFGYTASHYPRIHDISTDTVEPPRFVALVGKRGATANSIAYDDPAVAAQQRKAYPDLESLVIPSDSSGSTVALFDQARYTLEAMGLEIVAEDRDEGRIEATATSFWFGFKDDLVVRFRADPPAGPGETIVDIRSVSRIGQSDLGANAKRMRKFLFRMRTYKIR